MALVSTASWEQKENVIDNYDWPKLSLTEGKTNKITHRAVEGVFRERDVMVGHDTRNPASVFSTPQDGVQVGEVLEYVVTFFGPMAEAPVSHL